MDFNSTRILLGAAGAGGETYYFATITSPGVNLIPFDLDLDSQRNICLAGQLSSGNYFAVNLDEEASVLWGRQISSVFIPGVTTDSAGNVYIAGISSVGGRSDAFFAKYNSSGSIQWQRSIGDAFANTSIQSTTTDPSGNVYGGGAFSSNRYLVSYDSSGNLRWQRQRNGIKYLGVAYDSFSGNIFSIATLNVSGVKVPFIQFSPTNGLTSSGNILVDENQGINFADNQGAVAADGLGGIYHATTNGQKDIYIFKYDTSVNVVWQRKVTTISNTFSILDGTADDQGNFYIVGQTDDTPGSVRQGYVLKYNSSGTLQWQRLLAFTTSDNVAEGIEVDNLGNMYITGYRGGGSGGSFLLKLPTDGTRTGTYGSFTYGTTNFTSSTSSIAFRGTISDDPSTLSAIFVNKTESTLTASSSIITF